MKTLTLFFFIVFTTLCTVNAQITKGNWMVGGDASLNIDKSEGTSSSGFTSTTKAFSLRVTPNIGYFIIDKFAVGVSPFLGLSNPDGANNNVTNYGIGPFMRYYFLKTENRINLFAHTSYFLAKTKNQSGASGDLKSFEFKMGPVLYFNSSVGLELTLSYKNDNQNSSSGSEIIFDRISFNIGFQIHLEK
ncbi:hypothetical protein GCM10023311_20480 [Flaviramulus aquimarinus]|uniref:Outer membrane protein beta-barrel domain-containing protein n=1 Tax=Flaviramulus aquimarinus TaxID=1170456 RepID=A0ABP9F803_9FLAO